jgi:hypothetical protein
MSFFSLLNQNSKQTGCKNAHPFSMRVHDMLAATAHVHADQGLHQLAGRYARGALVFLQRPLARHGQLHNKSHYLWLFQ